jgi:hypothetical protein
MHSIILVFARDRNQVRSVLPQHSTSLICALGTGFAVSESAGRFEKYAVIGMEVFKSVVVLSHLSVHYKVSISLGNLICYLLLTHLLPSASSHFVRGHHGGQLSRLYRNGI